jgi:pilus assembly protein CpaB
VARRTLLIIASILSAALGTALIWLYVQGAETRANLVPALFLTKDLKAGESPASAVVTRSVSPETAAVAVTTLTEVGNQKLTVAAKSGQILLKSMLGPTAVDTTRFPKGGAVAVTINDPNRVPADLRAGDTVEIFELTKAASTKVLDDITVRSIGAQTTPGTGTAPGAAAAPNGAIPATIVGLNVTEAEAKTLYDIVARGGQIALYVRNPTPSS